MSPRSVKRFLQGSAIRRNTSMTLGRQLAAAAAQLLLVVVIARELGPEGNGLYAMAILLPSVMSTFLNLGVGPATVYYIGRGDVDGRRAARENRLLALWVSVFGLVLALPIVLVWGDSLFPGVPMLLLLIGLLTFPISLLLSYWSTVLQGLEDFRAFNWTVLAPPYVTLFITLVVIYGLDQGVTGAVIAFFMGQLAGVAIVWGFIRNLSEREVNGRFALGGRYKRNLLSYGWKAHWSNIMAFVNYRADIFLVNFFLNPAATGIYVIAVQMAERLWMFSHAASTVLLPRLSSMHADPQARYRLTIRATVLVGAVTLGASVLLTILLYFLIEPVFGEEYRGSLTPFLWLVPGVVAGAMSRIQSNCIAAAGKPAWNLYVSFFVVFINILGNLFLIPKYGLSGAAMATSIAYVANSISKYALLKLTVCV